MVVLKVSFLLSKNLIDPSVVKVSPYYFLYGKYLFFCVVLFYFYIYFATERLTIKSQAPKQNFREKF